MMVHQDAEKLAREVWDSQNDIKFGATQIEHQFRLCTVVNSIADQVELGSPVPTADVAGLEDFEAEVIRRLTLPVTTKPPKADKAEKVSKEK